MGRPKQRFCDSGHEMLGMNLREWIDAKGRHRRECNACRRRRQNRALRLTRTRTPDDQVIIRAMLHHAKNPNLNPAARASVARWLEAHGITIPEDGAT